MACAPPSPRQIRAPCRALCRALWLLGALGFAGCVEQFWIGGLPDGGNPAELDAGASFGTLSLLAGLAGGPGNINGTGAGARFDGPAGLAYDSVGNNLFVADAANTIRQIAVATRVVTTLAGSAWTPGSADGVGAAARFLQPTGLAYDSVGNNLFVADSDNSTIRQIAVTTGVVTTLAGSVWMPGSADGVGGAARFNIPQGLAYDGAGNLYVADAHNDTIRQVVVATGVVTTLAGSAGTTGSADGVGGAARFDQPTGLAYDSVGKNLFVADSGNSTIRQIVVATGVVITLAGSAGMPGSADGVGGAARFSSLVGLAYDGTGALYIVDTPNDTIRQIVVATGVVTTLAGSAGTVGSADGAGRAARFNWPWSLVDDGAGDLYVADAANFTIRKIALASGVVTTPAGSARTVGDANGEGAAARFNEPQGLAYDGAGNLYVADTNNDTIRQIVVATGVVTTLAGSVGSHGGADGVGDNASFAFPLALAYDGAGNLYVADTNNDTIRQIAVATGTVTTLAGVAGAQGRVDGVGPAARFGHPGGLAYDGSGNLYVADTYYGTIRAISIATGVVTTLAGSGGSHGGADGVGAAASFGSPGGLAYDGSGNLYVADTYLDTIRKIVLATGVVTTIAGAAGPSGSADGTGPAARFSGPMGLACDGRGNLYVADTGNHTIRKIVLATGAVTTVLGVSGQAGVVLGPTPAGLNGPVGLAIGPGGAELFVSESSENVILVAR